APGEVRSVTYAIAIGAGFTVAQPPTASRCSESGARSHTTTPDFAFALEGIASSVGSAAGGAASHGRSEPADALAGKPDAGRPPGHAPVATKAAPAPSATRRATG